MITSSPRPDSQLTRVQAGTALDRSYQYDAENNVTQITNNRTAEVQTFGYDTRDRLTGWTAGSTTQTFAYDLLGNMTSKAGQARTYGANANGTGAGPNQARSVGGQAFTYDAAGNLLSGPSRSYVWDGQNMPRQVTQGGVTERYLTGPQGTRVATRQGTLIRTTLGPLEQNTVLGGSTTYRTTYSANGQAIAVRGSGGTSYIHGDHLGSVGATTGAVVSTTEYDPWGAVRSGGATAATRQSFTGQERDDTGLLNYNARLYDPVLARFVSADVVVPSTAGGSMAGVQVKPLTTSFAEAPFLMQLNGESQRPFWFEMSGQQQQQAGRPWGPSNPQSLNRYSYVLNNPMRYTDPSGHTWYMSRDEADAFALALRALARKLEGLDPYNDFEAKLSEVLGGIATVYLDKFPIVAEALNLVARGLLKFLGIGFLTLEMAHAALQHGISQINELAYLVELANDGSDAGVALMNKNGVLYALNRTSGSIYSLDTPFWIDWSLPGYLNPGIIHHNSPIKPGHYFLSDIEGII